MSTTTTITPRNHVIATLNALMDDLAEYGQADHNATPKNIRELINEVKMTDEGMLIFFAVRDENNPKNNVLLAAQHILDYDLWTLGAQNYAFRRKITLYQDNEDRPEYIHIAHGLDKLAETYKCEVTRRRIPG